MDEFVLDPHQDDPPRIVPGNRQAQRYCPDQPVDRNAHGLAIAAHFIDARPVVAHVVQVVPAHFIDTDGEHRFEARIDALLDQASQHQLVDEKCCGMAEVENQRVTQCDRLDVIRLVAGQHFEQLFIAIEGGVEIIENLPALLFDVRTCQQRRAGKYGLLHSVTASGMSSTLPAFEPFGQGFGFTQAGEPPINGIVVTPHYVSQGTISYAGFDVVAIKSQVALHIEPVGSARYRTLRIDRASAGRPVQQRANDGARALAGQGHHVPADFLKAFWGQRGQPLPQQAPFRRGQSRHIGESPATTVAALPAQPVRAILPDGLNARVNINVKPG